MTSALLIVEVGFRTVQYFTPLPAKWSDRPKKFYLNSIHDDKPYPNKAVAKELGIYRILALGDSFTYGQGLQKFDVYPHRLESMLNISAKDLRAEVVNWGVRGYSTVQELELLNKGIGNINPDLVTLQITLNDPEIYPYRVTHPYLDEHGRIKLSNPIFKYWHSLQFVTERILNSQTHSDYEKYYNELFDSPETWNRFATALSRFKKVVDEHHVQSFAMVFPLFSHTSDDSYPFRRLHTKITDELTRLNIPFVDLLKYYKNIPPIRLQIIPGVDSHPNEIANQIAAEAIYGKLKKLDIIPREFLKAASLKER
jgi:lysophospholipase L1-like esterase